MTLEQTNWAFAIIGTCVGTGIAIATLIVSIYSLKRTKVLTRTKDLQDILEILETINFWFVSKYRTNNPIKSSISKPADARIVTLDSYKSINLISKLEKIKFKTIGFRFEIKFEKLIKSLYDIETEVIKCPAIYKDKVLKSNLPDNSKYETFLLPDDAEQKIQLDALNEQVSNFVKLTMEIEADIRKII